MFKKISLAVAGLLFAVTFAGCNLWEPEEILSDPDITLAELEKKMYKARDPEGVFDRAKSYVQKQIITQGSKKHIVEVKFLAPDRYKILTLEDNEPSLCFILNGETGWIADYSKRIVQPLVGDPLAQMKTFTRLGDPDDSYQDLFRDVTVRQAQLEGREYYKMICIQKQPGKPAINIYVNKNSFLIDRMRIGDPTNYDSEVTRYSLYEGVMIPEETVITVNGTKQVSTITYNKLNAVIDEAEFLPPVFTDQK